MTPPNYSRAERPAKPEEVAGAAVESSLTMVQLADLSDILTSLDGSDSAQEVLAKAVRGVERVRRGCLKVLSTADATESIRAACQHWVGCGIDLVEDLLQSPLARLTPIKSHLR